MGDHAKNFRITAWAPDGIHTVTMNGPISPDRIKIEADDWTLEEDQFLKNHLEDMSDEDLGAALGRTRKAVARHRSVIGLSRQQNAASRQLAIKKGRKANVPWAYTLERRPSPADSK